MTSLQACTLIALGLHIATTAQAQDLATSVPFAPAPALPGVDVPSPPMTELELAWPDPTAVLPTLRNDTLGFSTASGCVWINIPPWMCFGGGNPSPFIIVDEPVLARFQDYVDREDEDALSDVVAQQFQLPGGAIGYELMLSD